MSKKLKQSEEYAPIFNRLIALCETKGTSISQLLDMFTSSRSAISAWKNGNINANIIEDIATYLNVSIEYLVTGREGNENIRSGNRSIIFSKDTDFSDSTIYNMTGSEIDISPSHDNEYKKFSGIIEHIQSLSEREQWKAIFKLEDILKEEYPINSIKKNH